MSGDGTARQTDLRWSTISERAFVRTAPLFQRVEKPARRADTTFSIFGTLLCFPRPNLCSDLQSSAVKKRFNTSARPPCATTAFLTSVGAGGDRVRSKRWKRLRHEIATGKTNFLHRQLTECNQFADMLKTAHVLTQAQMASYLLNRSEWVPNLSNTRFSPSYL